MAVCIQSGTIAVIITALQCKHLGDNRMTSLDNQSSLVPMVYLCLFPPLKFQRYGDTYMAYLPLAHILELSAEISCISVGMKLGYGSPITLTTGGPGLVKGCEGDLMALQPTSQYRAILLVGKIGYRKIIIT